ncbi:class I SAM-dependent methyltransferase [Actinopolyspora erythraea]|uniref:Class I SAM-dependent methyltransferase n=1 Tax=Actinopolyspora erythraea TaxID=414996 RepID=A0A099DAN4_9ACTN|nr:class I SAM-dependent methyltransferase [Actinopolyspora erythraea]ASU80684.1 class I SAM-dependent methyltransferase [Actinopolyspora erythraea]KGI82941.1 ubiquinone biosynthesis methyltransferase UbiE [Actinopolyspora erythraea]
MRTTATRLERSRRHWDRHARSYDRQMGRIERRFFGDTRRWLCRYAEGGVLEVAIGTGLNLDHYPPGIRLTGVDLSRGMLDQARRRAENSGRAVDLSVGDAQRLAFPDASFDTVVCTFSLCAVPDVGAAFSEMDRVLKPGGLLLLADHVVSTSRPVRVVQRLLELVTVPLAGEYFRRRPVELVRAAGFELQRHERFKLGLVERVVARKPTR